jgi:hypothetical protein
MHVASNHRLTRVILQQTKRLSPGAAIFSLHTLASLSGRNANYGEKQRTGGKFFSSFYLYRFRKYVSYGFPIINFCNPGIHYETPCISGINSLMISTLQPKRVAALYNCKNNVHWRAIFLLSLCYIELCYFIVSLGWPHEEPKHVLGIAYNYFIGVRSSGFTIHMCTLYFHVYG